MQKIHSSSQFPYFNVNTRLLVDEFLARGIELWLLDDARNIYVASLKDHEELMCEIQSLKTAFSAFTIFQNKGYTKELFVKAGLSVPSGRAFRYGDAHNALVYAKQLGFPLVVKPASATHGDGVWTGLMSREEVKDAISANEAQFGSGDDFIIEKHIAGDEFRIFITLNGEFAAIHREPAYVVGDGEHDIKTLAEIESRKRRPPRENCLCEIVIDDIAVDYLARGGLNVDFVPSEGKKIYLRTTSNLKKGGMARDVTDKVHPSVVEICLKALKATHGLPYAGVDFICGNIEEAQSADSYAIVEINPDAGIGMHARPGEGSPQPVGKMIADVIFPETKGFRRP